MCRLTSETRSPKCRRSAFSLIELLVVMVIIVILIGTVIAIGGSQLEKAKRRETAGVLDTLRLAATQFAEENPLRQVRGYRARYGSYPPDELDGFLSSEGIPGSDASIAPGGSDLECLGGDLATVPNGDIKAFALAIRLYSEKGAAILDRVPPKYRAPAERNPTSGDVLEYLDRDDSDTFTAGDEPLDYFIDAWGTPIAYFAARPSGGPSVWDSDVGGNVQAAGDRRYTCGALLSLSNDVPVFVSYGPDGPEQFNADFFENGFPPDLIYDFGQDDPEYTFDHPLNGDNIYSNETVRDKILLTEMPEGQPIEGS